MTQQPVTRFLQWLETLDSTRPASWEQLPDIGLYMDQVQTYIDRQLSFYRRDEQDRLLTPAMINNYIKDDIIPRAESKKYSPLHLALLIIVGTLKPVLSMQQLDQLLSEYGDTADVASLYDHFLEIQHQSLTDLAVQVRTEMVRLAPLADSGGQDPCPDSAVALGAAQRAGLCSLAMQLSLEARTRVLIADRILNILQDAREESGPEKKAADKKQDRKKDRQNQA